MVAGIAGAERSVGSVMSRIGVALWKPGEVERGMERGAGAGHDVFRAGEHDGKITPRVEALAATPSVIDGALSDRQPLGRAMGQALLRTPWAIPCRG